MMPRFYPHDDAVVADTVVLEGFDVDVLTGPADPQDFPILSSSTRYIVNSRTGGVKWLDSCDSVLPLADQHKAATDVQSCARAVARYVRSPEGSPWGGDVVHRYLAGCPDRGDRRRSDGCRRGDRVVDPSAGRVVPDVRETRGEGSREPRGVYELRLPRRGCNNHCMSRRTPCEGRCRVFVDRQRCPICFTEPSELETELYRTVTGELDAQHTATDNPDRYREWVDDKALARKVTSALLTLAENLHEP
jgi:hypothetical protein